MSYKLDQEGNIKRLSDKASIPRDTGNRDYREFLAWVAAGNTPTPADPAPPVLSIKEVTQDRLTNDYLLNAILTTIAAKFGMPIDAMIAAVVAQVDATNKATHGNAPPSPPTNASSR